MTPRRAARLAVAGWWLLALLSVAFYFRQVGQLFVLGPLPWLRSLTSLGRLAQEVRVVVSAEPVWQPVAAAGQRALVALTVAFLIGAGCIILGAAVGRLLRWTWPNRRVALLFHAATGVAVLANTLLVLAWFGRYTPPVVRALVVTLGALATSLAVRELVRHWPAMRTARLRAARRRQPWRVLTAVVLAVALIGALAPESEWDALWYHLWLPDRWLAAGRPVDIVDEYIALYPLTWELLFGAALATGNAVAAKLLHYATLPLTALAVYELAARSGRRTPPWVAVVVLVSAPTVLWEATTAYIDLALAWHVALLLLALRLFAADGRRQWLLLAGLNAGLALATKHLALLAVGPAGVGLLLWLRRRGTPWGETAAALLAVGVPALLLPLPWYVRAWQASGNPLFPELYGWLGAQPPERWSTLTETALAAFKDHFGVARTPGNLLALPWLVTMQAYRFGGSLGLLPWLLLPGLLWRARRSWRSVGWLGLFVLAYGALWASPLSSFQLRFLVPLMPALAVLAAAGFGRIHTLLHPSPRAQRALVALVAGVFVLQLPPFTALAQGNLPGYQDWLTHVMHNVPLAVVLGRETEGSYLRRTVPSYAAWRTINRTLPDDAVVLTFSGGDHFYSRRARVSATAPALFTTVWLTEAGEVDAAAAALRARGVTHILYDKALLAGELRGWAIAAPGLVQSWTAPLYEDDGFVLHALRGEDSADE